MPVTLLIAGLFFQSNAQSLQINELMSSNSNTIYDEDGDSPDWIEIRNTGDNTVNLSEYYLSDNTDDKMKWQFPDMTLSPQQYLVIFASDKDRAQVPVYWKTLINLGDTWKYVIPTSATAVTWKTETFNDSGWSSGASGIGYGDGDDNTIIPARTLSVFMRYKFSVDDLETIKSMWFHMDYDDGFVAYLNNVEIARAEMGQPGSAVSWNQTASLHEALIYNGQAPQAFDVTDYIHLLKNDGNVLAVEVHNTGAGSSDLTGIPFLTVGSTKPFEQPKVSSYLNLPVLYPHTNFKLSSEGETVYLSTASSVVDSLKFDIIPGGYSYGRNIDEPDKLGFFSEPTPGTPNIGEFLTGFVKGEIEFSPVEMFLSSPTQMVLSGVAEGEEIRFTLDGKEPTSTSTLYTAPVTINKNTPVRARIFAPGGISSKIVSHTYVFDSEPTLPVVSIVTDSLNLWDNETGIYVLGDDYQNENPYFGANFWEDWEKPASIEMFGSDGCSVFSMNCGIKIFGAWSRATSAEITGSIFRKEYGDPVLENVQLFKSKPITEFKSLVFRNAGNDYSWARFRDAFMTDLASKMNNDIATFQPTIVYLNGQYWGHMNMREKINEDYLESNHGVDAGKIDMLEGNGSVLEGSNEKYQELLNFLNQNNMASDQNFEAVSGMMDIDNFIDYELSEIYFNNGDWPGNNIKFWRPQTVDGKWRWLMYDTDFGFGLVNSYTYNTVSFATATNGPSWPNPPWSTLVLRKLLENDSFKNKFINRFADMMNSTFVAESVTDRIDSIANIIRPEIQNNYQRWGTPSLSSWNGNVQAMKTFGTQRVTYIRNFIKQQFSLPASQAIRVSASPSYAGIIQLNTLTLSGKLWSGQYFQDIPITLTAYSYKGYKFKEWKINGVAMLDKTIQLNIDKSTAIEAVFEESYDDGKTIAINEINYNSPENDNPGDWVEIYNWGHSDIDISGWTLKDDDDAHAFVIPENTVLKSNDYLVLCRSSGEFSVIFPDVTNYVGDFDFGLGSAGDAVRLYDAMGILVDEVYFGSESPWVTEPNGNGPTLELRHFTYDNSKADSWKSSLVYLGTPGRENSITTDVQDIADNLQQKKLKIYPNPFSNETLITWENNNYAPMEIRIFTMDGRLVYRNTVSNGELVWDGTSDNHQRLNPGIYICNVQSEGKYYTEKLVLTQ